MKSADKLSNASAECICVRDGAGASISQSRWPQGKELTILLAGTGLHKSSIVQKIALAQADAVKHRSKAVGQVDIVTVTSSPTIINPNGRYTIWPTPSICGFLAL
jgi:hypothetical protein